MARNYRKVDGGITPWGLVCRLVMFLLFVAFGLSIVMQETYTQKIGRQINGVEENIARFRSANMMLQAQASELKTPRVLIQKVEEWKLNLRPVLDFQIVKCEEPSVNSTMVYAQTMIAQADKAGTAARAPWRPNAQPPHYQLRR